MRVVGMELVHLPRDSGQVVLLLGGHPVREHMADGVRVGLRARRQPERHGGEVVELPGGVVAERLAAEGQDELREIAPVVLELREHPPLDGVVGEGGHDDAHGTIGLTLGDGPHDERARPQLCSTTRQRPSAAATVSGVPGIRRRAFANGSRNPDPWVTAGPTLTTRCSVGHGAGARPSRTAAGGMSSSPRCGRHARGRAGRRAPTPPRPSSM